MQECVATIIRAHNIYFKKFTYRIFQRMVMIVMRVNELKMWTISLNFGKVKQLAIAGIINAHGECVSIVVLSCPYSTTSVVYTMAYISCTYYSYQFQQQPNDNNTNRKQFTRTFTLNIRYSRQKVNNKHPILNRIHIHIHAMDLQCQEQRIIGREGEK